MIRMSFVGAVLVFVAAARGAAGEQSAAAEKIPELEALQNFVGHWDSEAIVKNDERPEGVAMKGKAAGTWVHQGRFLRQTWSIEAGDQIPAMDGTSIRTYDPQKKVYRCWSFDSNGTAEESEGTWNPQTRTLEMTIKKNVVGGTSVVTSTFPEVGTETWQMVIKDPDGKILADISGKSTHRTK